MTSSRERILDAVRRANVPESPRPDLDGPWIRFDDVQARFVEMVEAVGGRCVPVGSTDELNQRLAELPEYAQAAKVCSLVEGVGRNDVRLQEVASPRELFDLDFVLFPAEFGVAENGAVWVVEQPDLLRAAWFVAQHAAVVLRADCLVHNMHEAYQRLTFDQPRFGCFISGPSKTADIEQSLVMGAQGPRSLTVFLLQGN